MTALARAIGLASTMLVAAVGWAQAPDPPLALDAKIPLGAVTGRIDHLAVDLKRQQLFVAELGNDSLGVVNLAAKRMRSTLPGLKEPQGIAYEPSTDIVYVANGGDGSVRLLWAEDLTNKGRIDLGNDADNVRIDAARNRVLVGYGKGALAVIDPKSRATVGDIPLKAHPESFQIDESTGRAFVNLPDAEQIAIVDLVKGEAIGALPTQGHRANFAMALDREAQRVLVVFRSPPKLLVMSAKDGAVIADTDTCGDSDDVFADTKRHRVYVSCGAGVVDVFEEHAGSYQRTRRIPTISGARTSLFVAELDRLFVAARATGEPAAIWVFRPNP